MGIRYDIYVSMMVQGGEEKWMAWVLLRRQMCWGKPLKVLYLPWVSCFIRCQRCKDEHEINPAVEEFVVQGEETNKKKGHFNSHSAAFWVREGFIKEELSHLRSWDYGGINQVKIRWHQSSWQKPRKETVYDEVLHVTQ